MASESSLSSSPSSSQSPSSVPSPSPGNSVGDTFIGSFISLISKYEIRYEGILYHLNVQDSTLGLKNGTDFENLSDFGFTILVFRTTQRLHVYTLCICNRDIEYGTGTLILIPFLWLIMLS